MDVTCEQCKKKGSGTLGDLLVAGWVQDNPDKAPSKRGWMCPSCVVTLPSVPRSKR
jgi:hypothetical protein